MSKLYKNKYRIESIRLKNWDYSTPASYFLTFCTKDRFYWFGDVKNAKMILSDVGTIADGIWKKIPKQFNHVELGPFIVMPNHVHGILILLDIENDNVEMRFNRVSTNEYNNIKTGGITGKQNPMLNNSISRIIRWYKGRCTFEIRKSGNKNFNWQELFYDHIIRDERDYNRILEYINNNPVKWQ